MIQIQVINLNKHRATVILCSITVDFEISDKTEGWLFRQWGLNSEIFNLNAKWKKISSNNNIFFLTLVPSQPWSMSFITVTIAARFNKSYSLFNVRRKNSSFLLKRCMVSIGKVVILCGHIMWAKTWPHSSRLHSYIPAQNFPTHSTLKRIVKIFSTGIY